MNLYAYVANNPLNATDPSGMCEDCHNPREGTIEERVEGFFDGLVTTVAQPLRLINLAGVEGVQVTITEPTSDAPNVQQAIVSGQALGIVADLAAPSGGPRRAASAGGFLARHSNSIIGRVSRLFARGCSCFEAGTLILTSDGERRIEEVRVGDLVLARDPETGRTLWSEVTDTFMTGIKPIWALTVSAADGSQDVQYVTDDHPYWVQGRGWTETRHLNIGDRLDTADGLGAEVVSFEETGRDAPVYNFSVADIHTYFAGDLGVLVHNRGCGTGFGGDVVFKTNAEAREAASALGYVRVRGVRSHGADVFRRTSDSPSGSPQYISRDRDGHRGGAWKGAERPNRFGTYDVDLEWVAE